MEPGRAGSTPDPAGNLRFSTISGRIWGRSGSPRLPLRPAKALHDDCPRKINGFLGGGFGQCSGWFWGGFEYVWGGLGVFFLMFLEGVGVVLEGFGVIFNGFGMFGGVLFGF